MRDNQYSVFQDIDRRCVAGGFQAEECGDAVRMKRECIESEFNRANPVVRDVLDGKTTFVAIYDSYSRGLRGIRRFLPLPHDPEGNERLRHLAEIIPNVKHFTRRSVFALDNPITCAVYGFFASLAVGIVWRFSLHDEIEAGAPDEGMGSFVTIGIVLIGFLAGLLAMMRYRTRDPKAIHAREAAAYMDINYEFFGLNNDRAWAEFIRQQGGAGASRIVLARPEGR